MSMGLHECKRKGNSMSTALAQYLATLVLPPVIVAAVLGLFWAVRKGWELVRA